MKLRRHHLLIAALVAWTVAAHRAIHLLVSPERNPAVVVDAAEDVATLSGGVALFLVWVRRTRGDERTMIARAAQQAAVAALGQKALAGADSASLMRDAADTVARTLDVGVCSVLEHAPREGGFVLRAGAGHHRGSVGTLIARDGERSMSGYTLLQGGPVLSNDVAAETRFAASKFVVDNGYVSCATVPIRCEDPPWGVLGVATKERRDFTGDDTAFLSSVANIVASALHRERIEGEANRFFESSQEMLAITDFDGVIRRVNPALRRTLGDGGDPVGRRYLDFVHPDDRSASSAETLLARSAEVVTVENRCIASDGTMRRVEWRVQADPERRLVYSAARDVTERRRMEARNTLLAQAIDQASETVVLTGADAVIQYVNPAFERVTGWSRAEIVGQKPSVLKSGKQDAAFYADLWKTLTAGDVWSGRFVNRRKDGSTYEAEGTISPVRDAAGRVVNFVAVMRDVTQETALQAQFTQAQKMEVVGHLAGGVAHDFNNLLCVIDGYGSLLLEEIPADDPRALHVAQIRSASRSATLLTRQLLAFSRKQDMQPRVLDLNALVRESSKMWTRLLGEDVRLETDLAPDLGRVKADPGQIDQVLMNLAINARDAMPSGGALTIRTRNVELDAAFVATRPGAREGRHVRVTVADEGVGMDEATLARIFEPFFTTKAPGKGTGLGLATVYGIVRQSEGFVDVESRPGVGTSFHVHLPRVDREVTAEDLAPRGDARASGGRETILVVEDEAAVRRLMCEVLGGAGYQVIECDCAQTALDALRDRDGRVDLLVTDVVMPQAGGVETARRLLEVAPTLRVLYVSGHTFEMISAGGIHPEGLDLLMKPFGPSVLLARVRAALDAPARSPEVAL